MGLEIAELKSTNYEEMDAQIYLVVATAWDLRR